MLKVTIILANLTVSFHSLLWNLFLIMTSEADVEQILEKLTLHVLPYIKIMLFDWMFKVANIFSQSECIISANTLKYWVA